MFLKESDKEILIKKISDQIDATCVYFNDDSNVYALRSALNDNIVYAIEMRIQRIANEYAKQYAKQAINSLIKELYTNSDFERDLGLK